MKWRERASIGLIQIIHTSEHNVRVYPNRLAISRKDLKDMNWEELQSVKEKIWGDVFAIELFPKCDDIVNLHNTRHLWKLPQNVETLVNKQCTHTEFIKEEWK